MNTQKAEIQKILQVNSSSKIEINEVSEDYHYLDIRQDALGFTHRNEAMISVVRYDRMVHIRNENLNDGDFTLVFNWDSEFEAILNSKFDGDSLIEAVTHFAPIIKKWIEIKKTERSIIGFYLQNKITINYGIENVLRKALIIYKRDGSIDGMYWYNKNECLALTRHLIDAGTLSERETDKGYSLSAFFESEKYEFEQSEPEDSLGFLDALSFFKDTIAKFLTIKTLGKFHLDSYKKKIRLARIKSKRLDKKTDEQKEADIQKAKKIRTRMLMTEIDPQNLMEVVKMLEAGETFFARETLTNLMVEASRGKPFVDDFCNGKEITMSKDVKPEDYRRACEYVLQGCSIQVALDIMTLKR